MENETNFITVNQDNVKMFWPRLPTSATVCRKFFFTAPSCSLRSFTMLFPALTCFICLLRKVASVIWLLLGTLSGAVQELAMGNFDCLLFDCLMSLQHAKCFPPIGSLCCFFCLFTTVLGSPIDDTVTHRQVFNWRTASYAGMGSSICSQDAW